MDRTEWPTYIWPSGPGQIGAIRHVERRAQGDGRFASLGTGSPDEAPCEACRSNLTGPLRLVGLLVAAIVLGVSPLVLGALPAGAQNCGVTTTAGLRSQLANSACTTIDVAAGTYNGSFHVARNVTIAGVNQSPTVLRGGSPVIVVGPFTVVLRKLTIEDGLGGITNSGTLTLEGVTVEGNRSPGLGGGVFTDASLTVDGSTILRNEAASGGGIYNAAGVVNVSSSIIDDNVVSGSGGAGGGIFSAVSATVSIENSQVNGNAAAGTQSGQAAVRPSGVVSGLPRSGGSNEPTGRLPIGTDGGGLFVGANGSVTLAGTTISGNAAGNGGGIYLDCGATETSDGSSVVFNTPNNVVQPACNGALSITKTDDDGGSSTTGSFGRVVPGSSVVYTIVVSNAGPSTATGALVNDPVPTGVSSDSWYTTSVFGASASITSGSGAIVNDSVFLPADSMVIYTVTDQVLASDTGSLSNTATMTPPPGFNDTSAADSATDADTLRPDAVLTLTKTDDDGGSSITGSPATVIPGTSVVYTIVVSNSGPSTAANVVVEDTLPSQGFSPTSATEPNGVTFNSSTDTWTIGTLAVGTSDTLTLTGTVPANATGDFYSNTATASATDAASDSATDTDRL